MSFANGNDLEIVRNYNDLYARNELAKPSAIRRKQISLIGVEVSL